MTLIFTDIICWGFVLYCLFGGRKIEKVLPSSSKSMELIFFGILAVLVVYKAYYEIGLYAIVHGALIMLAGILYTSIPSGYNDEAIYIKGKKYKYIKMDRFEINEERNCYRLSFIYRIGAKFVAVKKEDHYLLEDIQMRYRRARVLK